MAKLTEQETIELILLAKNIDWHYELHKYSDEELKKLLKSVRKAESEILGKIDTYRNSMPDWYEGRALAILDNLSNMTLGIQYILHNGITSIATQVGVSSFLVHNSILSFDGKVPSFNETSLTAEQLQGIIRDVPVGGNTLSGWVQKNYSGMVEEIRNEITSGMLQGDSYVDFTNRLTTGFDMSKKEAISLGRDYVSAINNFAREEVYSKNQDIIKSYKYCATLEGGYSKTGRGVCSRCLLLDSNVYLKGEPRPQLLLHPRCFIDGQTNIFTSKGWKQIKKIEIGDLVLTHKGRFRKVTDLIITPNQKPNVVKIKVWSKCKDTGGNGKFHFITATEEHPFLVNDEWRPIKNIKIGDKVKLLANKCKRCGKIIPYFYEYCSRGCLSLDITDRQWSDPEHRKNISKKISKWVRNEFDSGNRDRFEITKKANEKMRELVEIGEWNLNNNLEGLLRWAKSDEARKIHSERMKINNPSFDPEIRERQTKSYLKTIAEHPEIIKKRVESFKQTLLDNPQILEDLSVLRKKFYRENPEKHPCRILAKRQKDKGRTGIERKVEEFLREKELNYDFNYPIGGYFVDFALLDYNIAIECDGAYWHKGKEEQDHKRQIEIEELGWLVIRFPELQINKEFDSVKNEINRILMNHNNDYDFIDLEIVDIESWKIKKGRKLFNLSVDEDESYIAKGFVVHNCRCLYLPVMVSWKDLGFENIQELDDVARPWTTRPDKNIDAGGRRTILEHGFETGSYQDFFGKQSETFKNNALGPRRVELLNSGKVKWQDLVSRADGKLILLKELQELY